MVEKKTRILSPQKSRENTSNNQINDFTKYFVTRTQKNQKV